MRSSRTCNGSDPGLEDCVGRASGYHTNDLDICQDLNIDYSNSVVLYQSRFFEDRFPEENKNFRNVVFVDTVSGDRQASLLLLRKAMLSRQDINTAVFIGGMEGVEAEYTLFKRFHPEGKSLPVPATGGAARELAIRIGGFDEIALRDVDFAHLFHSALRLAPGN